jgi:hypothetical protein
MPDLIDRIEEVRGRNNGYWMQLLRIAMEADPDRTRGVLRRIEECDTMITRLLTELGETVGS